MDSLDVHRIVPRALTSEEIAFFKENNYVRVKQLLPSQDAATLLELLKGKMGEDAQEVFQPGDADVIKMRSRGGTPGRSPGFNKWGPIAVDCATGDVVEPRFAEFAQSREMGVIGRQLLGHPVRYWVDEALVKVKGLDPSSWHQDSGGTDTSVFSPLDSQLMVWIALDRIPPERGSMRFVPAQRASDEFLEIIKETPVPETYAKLEDLGVITEPFDLDPGDATIHGPSVFHSAPPNVTDVPRWAYVVSLFRADATWTGHPHWPMAGVEGLEVGKGFDLPRFPILG